MSIQFEWQAGRDDGQWETIAESERGPIRRWMRRLPWWAWVLVGLVVGGLAAAGYVNVRRRYEEMQRQITFQIQTVIDLEARAFSAGDVDLFIDQQDGAKPQWLALQGRRIQPDCATARRRSGPRDRTVLELCAPVLPAKVQNVDLQGDVAWVEVVEGQPPDLVRGFPAREVRRVRFYRQTDLGWKHTTPPDAFWRTVIRVDYGSLFVVYHKRDREYVEYLEETITDAFTDACERLTCSSANTLTVDFSVEPPPYLSPAIEVSPGPQGQDKITLSSPWLSGIPVSEDQDERAVQDLAHAVTFATAVRSIQYTSRRTLTPLQRALLDEYAAWYAYGREARLVLLRPLIGERGWSAAPDVLRIAKETTSLDQYLERWASMSAGEVAASPERAAAYFDALLNVEREALLLGRKETFLAFQEEGWRGVQERYYWLAQENERFVPDRPILVRSAQVSENRARVQLAEPLPSVDGLPPQSLGSVVYLQWQSGGWRHASVLDGYSWSFPPPLALTLTPIPAPSPAPTPTPSPTPTPTPARRSD
jgi:hypothetical protein